MQLYEIQPLVNDIYKRHQATWEQTRFIGYIIAQTNSTKRLTPTDILKFDWDNENEEENAPKTISNDDIARLREQAKNIQQQKVC